jgi:hypothetical protein
MGFHLSATDLLRPREVRRIIGRSALAVLQDRVKVDLPEQYIDLPSPIFRYYGLFPECFFAKMRTKAWLQANPQYTDLAGEAEPARHLLEAYRAGGSYDEFWKGVLDLQRDHRARGGRINKEFLYARYVPDAEHPEMVRALLGQARYAPPGTPGPRPGQARDPAG